MNNSEILKEINSAAATKQMKNVLSVIDEYFNFEYTYMINGKVYNEPNANVGSFKLCSVARFLGVATSDMLSWFCEHYQEVLDTPKEKNHENIRTLINGTLGDVTFYRSNPCATPAFLK